ncbi:MAG: universal stress protein [Polyangiaceae bacterium]
MSTRKILVPVDGSDCSRNALAVAGAWAKRMGAELWVLHAYHVPHYIQPSLLIWMGTGPRPLWELAEEQAAKELDELLATSQAAVDSAHRHLVHGDPSTAILALVEREKHDLIIMGTHGRSGAKRLALGSVAERVVRRAPCPVLVIPTHETKDRAEPLFEPRLL